MNRRSTRGQGLMYTSILNVIAIQPRMQSRRVKGKQIDPSVAFALVSRNFILFRIPFIFHMASESEVQSPDFSQSWKLSDVVLVVEEERFHVHRAVLALWSPVFEKMFTSEFQERDKNEVPLPGKKASEIKELLQLIYPSLREKSVTEENCYFLVKLAHEYQMEAIITRCEDFMVNKVTGKPKDKVLADLIFAQTYELEKLRLMSVNQAYCLSLEELKNDEMYDRIQADNLKEIMEGIIKRLQRELEEAQRVSVQRLNRIDGMQVASRKVKCDGLLKIDEIAKFLVAHASSKQNYSYIGCTDTDSYLAALQRDTGRQSCKCGSSKCDSLSNASSYLKSLKKSLSSLSI